MKIRQDEFENIFLNDSGQDGHQIPVGIEFFLVRVYVGGQIGGLIPAAQPWLFLESSNK